MKEADNYFLKQSEPNKSCLLALRNLILRFAPGVTEVWRYRMPFYLIDGKRFCYLWVQKKSGRPYLGIVDGKNVSHPKLVSDGRSRMKIMLIDPPHDLPVGRLKSILAKAGSVIVKNHSEVA